MLVLERKSGQWIDVIHNKTGDLLRFRVYFSKQDPTSIKLAFDDSPKNFEIQRPERILKVAQT